MIVFDVVINGKVQETIKPANQRLHEMYWFVIDRVQKYKVNNNSDVKLIRRIAYETINC